MSVPGGFGNRDFFDGYGQSEDVSIATGANANTLVNWGLEVSNLTIAASASATMALPTAPTGIWPGQVKRIVAETVGSSGVLTVSGAFLAGEASATDMVFDAANEYAELVWTGTRFVVLAYTAVDPV